MTIAQLIIKLSIGSKGGNHRKVLNDSKLPDAKGACVSTAPTIDGS